MAIPVLYWMLECTGCGARRVVRDRFLLQISSWNPKRAAGAGYGGPPLPERYRCSKGCSRRLKAIGSIHRPDDETMWLHEPHQPVKMTQAQIDEWRRLIETASTLEEHGR